VRFYDRPIAAGKSKRAALIACARRLLTILNAVMRRNTFWSSLEAQLRFNC
jgi:transposase